MRFASFLFGGFTTMAVINPSEKKVAERRSVRWLKWGLDQDNCCQGEYVTISNYVVHCKWCSQQLHITIYLRCL